MVKKLGIKSDVSQGYRAPAMVPSMAWQSIGSSGLRQYSGWVREEFLPQLRGREAARTYREMQDNSPTVGAIMFAIQQSMRQVTWRVEAPDDRPESVEAAEFVQSCMGDMSQSWADFTSESLSMLTYGFAPHEIVYKRRLGPQKRNVNGGYSKAPSKYTDGKVGWSKLALRGQDTVIKWFFDEEGNVTGLTQQPWFGGLIDIPIEKILLFRPRAWKNNPEGYSILRSAYRPWWFTKRLEEQEAISLERMSGTPEYRLPAELLEAAANGDANALAQLEAYKSIVTGIKVDEQMGLITPSDTFSNTDGTKSNVPMYEFRYNVPQGSRAQTNFDVAIQRYKLDMMTSVLADFLQLGHQARGTQNLAVTKVDLFFQAIEGWLEANASVLNNDGLQRLWELNGFDPDTMPHLTQDMPKRVDLDQLGTFVLQMAQAGARMFPDDDLENYLRDVADLPELSEGALSQVQGIEGPAEQEELQKHIGGMLARRFINQGFLTMPSGTRKSRRRSAPADGGDELLLTDDMRV
jgi:hypothetical protein